MLTALVLIRLFIDVVSAIRRVLLGVPHSAIVIGPGGPSKCADSAYIFETPIYGISGDFEQIRDKTHTFNWRVESKWYSNVQLTGVRLKIEEVWESANP